VVSILERERRLTQWDIKPAGYENITAEQAKLSGMFPLPGAPRTQPMDPSRLQAFMNQPAGSASTSALKPANAKQAKRLLVHNLPQSATNDSIADFFNLHMNGVNVVSGSDPCISAHLSQDKTFAVLEFKTAEDATYALALDGIPMQDLGDMQVDRPGLSIRRPKEYIAPSAPEDNDAPEGQLLSVVKDGPNKISVTNIPIYIDADQMIELFKAFGELKAFVLAQEIGSDSSRVSLFTAIQNFSNNLGHCFL
jgi:splicing factor U2AF subunit